MMRLCLYQELNRSVGILVLVSNITWNSDELLYQNILMLVLNFLIKISNIIIGTSLSFVPIM
jgi:hypothetical protein